ncbi:MULTISPECIES: ATP-binding protein [unclassified Oceanobacillus]|uniref:ATP-binding protein n=1 Tax=unclassified Oceanobacillus TaxID=2630292 RepID=UPI00300E0044
MNISSGIGDPYFYEWTVGLDKITSMLIPEEEIKSVTLQASIDTLDDVVCEYCEKIEYIQVKHTRVDEKIGFSFLLTRDKKSDSLLMKIAKSWMKEKSESDKDCYATLLTNREPVTSATSIIRGDVKIGVPSFKEFFTWFQQTSSSIQSINTLRERLPNKEWANVLEAWLEEIDVFEDENETVEFIQKFKIEIEHPNTLELDKKILEKIINIFSVSQETGLELYKSLFYSLKKWASSTREKEKITVEEVYSSLAIKEERYPQHLLLPPSPFFESRKNLISYIEERSKNKSQKMLFLYGKPGIGKTSLVNFLANKPDTIVDLRYHAYIPVTPEYKYVNLDFDKSITEEMMWGSLLNQLRELFRGKLYKYKVPIRNQFLSKEELRETVLRLASEFGKIHNKNTVIVIDGIDHAARSGSKETFLRSLISPEIVPDNIFFILCGQPAEDYEDYPIWLNSASESLDKVELTGITLDDIKVLLRKINPNIDDFNSAAKIIYEISKGNTLSATFAAYESKNIKESTALFTYLNEKNLSSNIIEYYDSIWNSLDEKVFKNGYQIKDLLATLFSITIEKVSIDDILEIFKSNEISKVEWQQILNFYSPLVIENEGKYALYHNDIRVYLKNKLRKNSNIITYVAGKIATYYLNFSKKIEIKHRDIFRLLDLANRSSEKLDVFSMDYVNEAITLGQEIDGLLYQFKEVVQQSKIDYDFEKIQNISLTAIYLNQYIRIMDYYEDLKPTIKIPNLLYSEYERINLNSVKIKDIKIVVDDINTLVNDNQSYRAKALFDRWFGDFQSVITHVSVNELWHQDQGLSRGTSDTLTQIGYLSKILNSNIYIDSIEIKNQIKSLIIYGQLEGLANNTNTTILQFARFFNKNIRKLSINQLEDLLDKLFQNQEWLKLSYVLSKIKKNKDWSYNSLDIKILFLNTLIVRKKSTDPIYNDVKLKGFKALSNQDYHYNNKLNMYSAYSFILGYLGDFGSKELQINEGIHEYYLKYGDDRGRPYLKRLIRISFELGNIFETKKYIAFSDFRIYLDYLFDECMTPFLNGIYGVANQLSKFIFYLIENSNDGVLESKLTSYLLNRTKGYDYRSNYSVTLTWEYLATRGYYNELENWFEYWLGVKGRAWNSSLQDSISTYNLFSELMLKYEVNKGMVDKARKRLYENLLGFIEHKDGVLHYPYEVFKRVVEDDLSYWSSKGLDLYNLSLLASEKGDNLLASSIEDLFFESAILSGSQEFYRLLNNDFFEKKLITKINHIIYFFKENWKTLDFEEEDLLGLWCLIEATSSKISNNDNARKIEFSNQIIEKLSNDNERFLKERTDVLKKVYIENLYTKDDPPKGVLKYYELPIDKLVSEFLNDVEQLEYKSHAWERFEIIASRIGNYRTKDFTSYRDALFSFFINRENHYSWESDNANVAAESLIPLLSPHQIKEMYADIIDSTLVSREPSYWLSSFTDDVNNYVLYMIKAYYPNKLIPFFEQQISMLSSWHNSNFRKVTLPSIKKEKICWLDIFEQLLWLLFSTENIERTMNSLNGMYYFMKNLIHRFDFVRLPSQGSVKQKYFILLLLEKLAREKQDITVAEPFLNYCINDSKLLNLRLQSSLVLAYKNQDMNKLENPLNRKSVEKILTQPKSESIEIPFLIQRNEKLLGMELVSAYLESYLSLEREYLKIKEIDLREDRILKFMGSDKEDFIVQRFLNNKFEHLNTSISTLCQLCLPIDEPDIILFNPAYYEELDNFCNNQLEEQLIIQSGNKILNANIPENEVLVAGTISFYPSKESKIMAFSKKIVSPYYNSDEEIGKMFGGRQFLKNLAVTESDSNENCTLFNLTYGYCYFVNEYYKMSPSNLFVSIQEWLGKKYEIRFELSYGKGEEFYMDMATFRQPTMQRWIMKKADVEELQKELGILLVEANEIGNL